MDAEGRTRAVLWLGAVAAAAPLVALVVLQYRAFSRLENAAPTAARAKLAARLRDVAESLQAGLREEARRRLAIPPGGLPRDVQDESVEAVFRDAPAEGVKRYFVGSPAPGRRAFVWMYNPATRSLEEGISAENLAAFGAFIPLVRQIREEQVVDPDALSVAETDPDNRIILRPVTDEAGRMVAVEGLIVDPVYYRERFLPERLKAAVATSFGDYEAEGMVFSVRDDAGAIVFSTGPADGAEDEARAPLPFVFTGWSVGARFRDGTYEGWARRLFVVNMSLSLLMAAALAAAVAFAFRASARAVKLSQMKTDFVSNVSHELRTPLASIRVLGEFLKLGWYEGPERVQEYGGYIEAESERLTRLVDNILDFSKIESGRRAYRFEVADLGDLVADAAEAVRARAASLGLEVVVEQSEGEPVLAAVDSVQMAHAILNLLDNAVKYSNGSQLVRARAAREGDRVAVSVRDYGVGIARGDHARIFERFYRVHTGLVHDVKGSGLGLSIVKQIVEAHGGEVRVESAPGEGSTFTILLPAAS